MDGERVSGFGVRANTRAFSLVELLVALAISAALLTAMLSALDASWRTYKVTTESASTHVVSRIVVTRLLAMIRTGTQFGPYPADVLDVGQNPLTSTYIEFLSEEDRLAGVNRVTRMERRDSATQPGLYELWYVRLNSVGTIIDQRPLLRSVKEATFILEYEPGPRLKKATVDLTIQPNDDADIRTGGALSPPDIRLVASSVPRQLQ